MLLSLERFLYNIMQTGPTWKIILVFGTISLLVFLPIPLLIFIAVSRISKKRGVKPQRPRDQLISAVIQVVLTTGGGVALYKFAFTDSPASYLTDIEHRVGMCLAILVLAVLFVVLAKRFPWIKRAGGVVKVSAALASTYVQLGKYAADPKGQGAFDRWSFIIGGILVLASGVKDIYEMDEKGSR